MGMPVDGKGGGVPPVPPVAMLLIGAIRHFPVLQISVAPNINKFK